jgi:hypothetical protein
LRSQVIGPGVTEPTGLDLAVIRARGTIAIYGTEGGESLKPDVARSLRLNARYQFALRSQSAGTGCRDALRAPTAKVLVHCHMGINRAGCHTLVGQ